MTWEAESEARMRAIRARARATFDAAQLRAQLPGAGRFVAAAVVLGLCACLALAGVLEAAPASLCALAAGCYAVACAIRRAALQSALRALDFDRLKADEALRTLDRW